MTDVLETPEKYAAIIKITTTHNNNHHHTHNKNKQQNATKPKKNIVMDKKNYKIA